MKEVKIGDICEVTSSKRIYASEYKESGIPFYRSREIIEKSNNKNISEQLYISEERFKELKNKFGAPTTGDILLTSVGTLGIPYIVKEDDEFYFKDGNLTWMKNFSNDIIPEYLYYWLSSDFGKKPLIARAIGSSQGAITIDILKKYKILMPEVNVQIKIINILKNMDYLLNNNNRRIFLLEQMAEEIYKEWFIRFRFPGYESAEFENGIPKEWQVKKVKDCVKRMNFGITYKAEELEEEGNVIVIDQSKEDYLGFHNNEPSHKADLDNPIMLFGDHSCKTKIMIKDFSLGENVIPYISSDNDEINNYYLYYATKRLIETEEYKRHWNRFCGFKILIPPIVLQNKFMQYIKMMEQEKELLWQENQNLIKQRDLLLPRLMSGKLEVK